MKKHTAFVIVAGIDGIAVARLAKNGCDVTVQKKEASLGVSAYSGPVLLPSRSTTEPIFMEKGTISVQNLANAVAAARA